MKYLLLIAASLILTACGSDKKSSKDESIREIRPVGKTASIDPVYIFNSPVSGTINAQGSCKSQIKFAHKGINRINLEVKKEGIYSDCSLQVVSEDGEASDVLHISQFEVNVPKTITTTIERFSPPSKKIISIRRFDEYGLPTHYSNGSSPGSNYKYQRDNQGRLEIEFQDNNGDNIYDYSVTHKYTDDGELHQLIKRNLKFSSIVETITITRKNAERKSLVEWRNSAGKLTKTLTHTFNKYGSRELTEEISDIGIPANSKIELTYDSNNFLKTMTIYGEFEYDPEHPTPWITEYAYNKYGDLETKSFLDGNRKRMMGSRKFINNPDGRVLREERESPFKRPDGTITIGTINTYTYDDYGSILTINSDMNADGRYPPPDGDEIETRIYEY